MVRASKSDMKKWNHEAKKRTPQLFEMLEPLGFKFAIECGEVLRFENKKTGEVVLVSDGNEGYLGESGKYLVGCYSDNDSLEKMSPDDLSVLEAVAMAKKWLRLLGIKKPTYPISSKGRYYRQL